MSEQAHTYETSDGAVVTHCYCFACGVGWRGDLKAHECRVDAPERQLSPQAKRDLFPIYYAIQAQRDPYGFVNGLSRAQGGMCSCGKCAHSLFEVTELDPLDVVLEYGPNGMRRSYS